MAVALYVIDAAVARGSIRLFFTGPWYQDTYRLAALLPIFSTVLASVGVAFIAGETTKARIASRHPFIFVRKHRQAAKAGVFAVLALTLAAATQGPALKSYISLSQKYYAILPDSSILSSDESALLERLPSKVPASAVIADNPWNGSSLAFAISDRKVLTYHMFDSLNPNVEIIVKHLNDADTMPAVCKAIRAENVSYVLDFGSKYLAVNPAAKGYEGLDHLATSGAVRLVDSQGNARLYKVTACG